MNTQLIYDDSYLIALVQLMESASRLGVASIDFLTSTGRKVATEAEAYALTSFTAPFGMRVCRSITS